MLLAMCMYIALRESYLNHCLSHRAKRAAALAAVSSSSSELASRSNNAGGAITTTPVCEECEKKRERSDLKRFWVLLSPHTQRV